MSGLKVSPEQYEATIEQVKRARSIVIGRIDVLPSRFAKEIAELVGEILTGILTSLGEE